MTKHGLYILGLVGNVNQTKKGGYFATVFDGVTAHKIFIGEGAPPQTGEVYQARIDQSMLNGQPFMKQLQRIPLEAVKEPVKPAAALKAA